MSRQLTRKEICDYLKADKDKTRELFAVAKEERQKNFGNAIFLYGFVYFSTWCRNDCHFCYFRKSNAIGRYRKSNDEVLSYAGRLIKSGVNLIDLTMGEDPAIHEKNFENVFEIIKELKENYDIPVMISPGVVSQNITDRLEKLNTDWYALYQETHNRALFETLRVCQDYDERMKSKLYAKKKGILFEEGIMSGIGESDEDIADSIIAMGEIGASQMRVMSFVPQKGSPMENCGTPDRERERKIIALMRIQYPHVLIPASLDVDGIEGLQSRLDAGANVVTSIIPPGTGLMGVAQSSMDVDEGGRTVEEVVPILEKLGLRAASQEEYVSCLRRLKKRAEDTKTDSKSLRGDDI